MAHAPKTTVYRGHTIVRERWSGETTIWVEGKDGPFDAPTMKRAREYIDAMIEEDESLAADADEREYREREMEQLDHDGQL